MNWISRCKSQLRCHAARRWCVSLLLAAFILGAISSVWMVARNSARVDRRDDIDTKECDHVADVIVMLLESAHHIEHPCLHESSKIAPRINSMFEDEARLILQRKGYHIPRNWTTIFNKMLVDDRECRWEASRLSTNGISIVRDNDREAVFNSDEWLVSISTPMVIRGEKHLIGVVSYSAYRRGAGFTAFAVVQRLQEDNHWSIVECFPMGVS